MEITTIKEQIMFGNLTNDQLDLLLNAIRFAKTQLIRRTKNELQVGSSVKFTKSKTGTVVHGTVDKINRKYVIVAENKPNTYSFNNKWKVPAYMLEVI